MRREMLRRERRRLVEQQRRRGRLVKGVERGGWERRRGVWSGLLAARRMKETIGR
jgi:hypothetical protein